MTGQGSFSKLKIFLIVFFVILIGLGAGFGIPFGIKCAKRNKLTELGYDETVANYVLDNNYYEHFLELGYNETLNRSILQSDFKTNYLDNYAEIDYRDYSDFLQLVNAFLDKKYTPDDINFIFERFEYDEVSALSERDYLPELHSYFDIKYAKLRDLDRYLTYKNDGRSFEDTVLGVSLNLDLSEYEVDFENTEFSTDMLVNKNFSVSKDFEPKDLVDAGNGFQLNKEAYGAFIEMQNAAKSEGYSIEINSAYRSVSGQESVMSDQCRRYGDDYCKSHVATPGFSEHHTGLAIDIKSSNTGVFEKSKEFDWVIQHAAEYGFILRYPKDKEMITRYDYEAWHFRYLGKDLAKKVTESGLSYEEYYVKYIEK